MKYLLDSMNETSDGWRLTFVDPLNRTDLLNRFVRLVGGAEGADLTLGQRFTRQQIEPMGRAAD